MTVGLIILGLVRGDLLDALTTEMWLGGRRLPCGALRSLIEDGGKSSTSRISHRVLLLAGVYARLAESVLADFTGRAWAPPRPMHWRRDRAVGRVSVPGHVLQFASAIDRKRPVLARATHRFITALPVPWVRELVEWAPPVVALPANPAAPVPVLENVLAGFLAVHALPYEVVRVVPLSKPTGPRFSLVDVASFAAPHLRPLVNRYRDRIVVASSSIELACELTGLHRAMAFRIRQVAHGVPVP